MIQSCTEQVINGSDLYSEFHEEGSLNQFVNDMMEYFNTGRYKENVVDILIKLLADALKINLFMYANNGGKIEVQQYKGAKCDKNTTVYVKFSSASLHYDAIICQKSANVEQSKDDIEINPSPDIEVQEVEQVEDVEEPTGTTGKNDPSVDTSADTSDDGINVFSHMTMTTTLLFSTFHID